MSARFLTGLLMVGDFFVSITAFILAFELRFLGHIPAANLETLVTLAPFLGVVSVVTMRVYDEAADVYRPIADVLGSSFVATFLSIVLGMTLPYLFHLLAFPRSVFLIALPIQLLLHATFRGPLLAHVALHRLGRKRVAIVGTTAGRWAAALRRYHELQRAEVVSVECAVDDLTPALARTRPTLVVMLPAEDQRLRQAVMLWCIGHGVPLHLVPNPVDILVAGSRKSRLGDVPILITDQIGLKPDQALVKRLFDVCVAVLGLAASAPLWPLIAAAVAVSSPGPVFYQQERVGRGGKPFSLLKFRTMRSDAERQSGPTLATPHDPRVTAVGRFLRAARLDELPQLLNVLAGSMSIVGPRPERPAFVAAFQAQNPAYALRHAVKPGITGLAQVLGKYETDADVKLLFDLMYTTQPRLSLDLAILVATIKAVLFPGLGTLGVHTPPADAQTTAAREPDTHTG